MSSSVLLTYYLRLHFAILCYDFVKMEKRVTKSRKENVNMRSCFCDSETVEVSISPLDFDKYGIIQAVTYQVRSSRTGPLAL